MVTIATIEFVISLYREYGSAAYDGEPVSQTEHMLQCASLARRSGYGEDVTIAAFLHDIGHLLVQEGERMGKYGMMHHEIIGMEFLSDKGFPDRISKLVGSHVDAKRYLTAVDLNYFNKLSDTSKETLKIQGGPMTSSEAEEFKSLPDFELYIQLRKWDEQAKVKGIQTISLDDMEGIMKKFLLRES